MLGRTSVLKYLAVLIGVSCLSVLVYWSALFQGFDGTVLVAVGIPLQKGTRTNIQLDIRRSVEESMAIRRLEDNGEMEQESKAEYSFSNVTQISPENYDDNNTAELSYEDDEEETPINIAQIQNEEGIDLVEAEESVGELSEEISPNPLDSKITSEPVNNTFTTSEARSPLDQSKPPPRVIVISKEERKRMLAQSHPPPQRGEQLQSHPPPQLLQVLTNRHCKEKYCLEYLSKVERYIYSKCAARLAGRSKDTHTCSCAFKDWRGKKRRSVAIVSLPGAGNTWVRGLLERVTGICTGSVYCDKTLLAKGFCGEGIRGPSVLAVKTHDSPLQWRGSSYQSRFDRPFFDAAIFVIRNPFNALVAEWNRQMSNKFSTENQTESSHVKYLNRPGFFGKNIQWERFTQSHSSKWKYMINYNLLRDANQPQLVVLFEDLKRDSLAEVKKMLDFLQIPFSDAEVEEKLQHDFTLFFRNHTDSFEHFTAVQKKRVNGVILSTVERLQSSHRFHGVANKLKEYVWW